MIIGEIKRLAAFAFRESVRRTIFTRQVNSTTQTVLSSKTMADGQLQTADMVDSAPDSRAEKKNSVALWHSSYMKLAHVKLMEGSTPQSARVLHPGPALEMIDRYGHPSLISLLKIASISRMLAMHSPVDDSGRTFFDYGKLTNNYFTFFHTTCVTIAKSMYDPQVSKWPLEVEVRPGHIGNTSLSTVSTITSPSDKQSGELYSQIAQVVLVDKVTRRPTPVADEWRRLYLPHCVRGEQPLIIPRQQVPTDGAASVYQVKVSWSDTDNYNHTNFASYPRFALDAIHDALSQGLLPESLSEKDIAAGVAEVKISYIGEAVEGDMLQVHVWCPEKTERTVVCSMNKEGQLINQVTLIFHSADTTCQL